MMNSSGGSLTDPLMFGKYKNRKIWEVPESYWKIFCKKNSIEYSNVLDKISEAKAARDKIENRPKRRNANPEKIRDWLFQHQKGFVSQFGSSNYALLWAGIGTGKTFASSEMVRLRANKDDKILILCPKSVFSSWQKAIGEYFDGRATSIAVTGTQKKKEGCIRLNRNFYITNYETLLNDELFLLLRMKGFNWIIADEAHQFFCNVKNKTFKRAYDLSSDIEMKYILTGSPRRKSSADFYGLITFLDRGERFGYSYYSFKEKFIMKVSKNQYLDDELERLKNKKNKTKEDIERYRKINGMATEELNKAFKSEFINKLKSISYYVPKTVLNLKEPLESIREIELTGKAKEYYLKMQKDGIIELEEYMKFFEEYEDETGEEFENKRQIIASVAIARITKLRQICSGFVNDTATGQTEVFNQDKLKELKNIIEEIDESVLITTSFKEEITQIEKLFDELNISYGVISGKIKQEDRNKFIEQFSNGKIDAMIIQESAGGIGIDGLQKNCSLMIEYSKGYSYDKREQKIGRLQRSGQKNGVRIIIMESILGEGKYTIERDISKNIEQKEDGVNSLIRNVVSRIKEEKMAINEQ